MVAERRQHKKILDERDQWIAREGMSNEDFRGHVLNIV